jgi:phage-related protein
VKDLAEIHFEGDSKEVISRFPADVRQNLGFALWELQNGRPAPCATRAMSSIGSKVFELKDSDERTWYRVIYVSKIGNAIHVLHSFEKNTARTDRRDIQVAKQRLSLVMQRVAARKANEKARAQQTKSRREK